MEIAEIWQNLEKKLHTDPDLPPAFNVGRKIIKYEEFNEFLQATEKRLLKFFH